ncbi:MAG: hypothetical protein J6Y95_00060 [Lachnospiraceae bacterium]|nr:hypothetical protein [Lachnospiraceae bacterium]
MKHSKYNQLKTAVERFEPGTVMVISDFVDVAQPKTVSKMLTRLEEEGAVERVLRSVYWKPGEAHKEPNPNDVAEALARENSWVLAPSGDTALFLMGLQAEIPPTWTYITSGTYQDYSYGGTRISFTHTNHKFFSAMSKKTRLLVQCIKAFGHEHLSEEKLKAILQKCKDWNWKTLLNETKSATRWVSNTVNRLFDFMAAENTVKGK